jgi:microcystin-dependent protein
MPRIRGIDNSGSAIGQIIKIGQDALPPGVLLCDGSSYLTTAYPYLFAAIGYTWGGSGSNFNVPDLRSRSPMGDGQGSGLSARTLAQLLGEEDHTLSAGELALHTHSGNTGYESADHTHYFVTYQDDYANLSNNQPPPGFGRDGGNATYNYTSGQTANHYHSFTTDNGSSSGVAGAGHNTIHPVTVVRFGIAYI